MGLEHFLHRQLNCHVIRKILLFGLVIVFDVAVTVWLVKSLPGFFHRSTVAVSRMDDTFLCYLTADDSRSALTCLLQMMDMVDDDNSLSYMQEPIIARLYLLHTVLGNDADSQFWLNRLKKSEPEARALVRFIAGLDYRSGVIWGECALARLEGGVDIKPSLLDLYENEKD